MSEVATPKSELTTAEREAKSQAAKAANEAARLKAEAAKSTPEAKKPETKPEAKANTPPKPAKCDALPEGAKFKHVTTWRKLGFFLVKGANGASGTALLVPGKSKPLFWLDKPSDKGGEGRRQANLFARHAVSYWTGWTGSEHSDNSPSCEGSPWVDAPTPFKKAKA